MFCSQYLHPRVAKSEFKAALYSNSGTVVYLSVINYHIKTYRYDTACLGRPVRRILSGGVLLGTKWNLRGQGSGALWGAYWGVTPQKRKGLN